MRLLTAAHVAKEVAICDSDSNDEEIDEVELFEKNEELKELIKRRRALQSSGTDRREKKVKKKTRTVLSNQS